MRRLILSFAMLLLVCGAATATEYFVYPGQSIQTAIDGASAGDIISITAGTDYVENLTWDVVDLTVRGIGATRPTIVPSDPTLPTLSCSDLSAAATLQFLMFDGGDASGANYSSGLLIEDCLLLLDDVVVTGFNESAGTGGGALRAVGGLDLLDCAPSFQDCLFDDNSSTTEGGAIYATGTRLNMTDTTFDLNAALRGGAIALQQGAWDYVEDEVIDADGCTFTGNAAMQIAGGVIRKGGAVYTLGKELANTMYTVSVEFHDCLFQNNSSERTAGALYLDYTTAVFDEGCEFLDNSAARGNGGAIEAKDRMIRIEDSLFSGNTVAPGVCPFITAGCGGAVALIAAGSGSEGWGGPIEIRNNIFTDNHATWGGGLSIGKFLETSGIKFTDVSVEDNVFTYNSAYVSGGGMMLLRHHGLESTTLHRVANNTIQYNEANPALPYGVEGRSLGGGGLYVYGGQVETIIEGNDIGFNSTSGQGGGIITEDCSALFRYNKIHDNSVDSNVDENVLDAVCAECPDFYSCNDGWAWLNYRYLAGRGGGIACTGSDYVGIVGNEFLNNSVYGLTLGAGGGISMRVQPGDTIEIIANLIGGNDANHEGGGIHVEYWPYFWEPHEITDATIDMVNNTIVDNQADFGGGFYVYEETQQGYFANNILTCNSANYGGGVSAPVGATITPARYAYNDLYENVALFSGSNWGGPFNPITQEGFGNIMSDPQFTGFANCQATVGGLCDFRLANASAVKQAGDPTSAYQNCDGSRNDMGLFGGPALCDDPPCDLPWIVNVASGTGPNCEITFTWDTQTLTTSRLGYKLSGDKVYTWLSPSVGTSHSATFTFTDNDPYNVKIEATLMTLPGLKSTVYRNFRYLCYSSKVVTGEPAGPTTIRFDLSKSARVSLAVYDVGGRKVRTLVNEVMDARGHVLTWNGLDDSGRSVSNGIYFFRLDTEERSDSKKIILLR